jgi:hypothetical protein
VDVWFDDKSVSFTSWKAVLPIVTGRLLETVNEHPSYAAGPLIAIEGGPMGYST